jgi:hypothetical protein
VPGLKYFPNSISAVPIPVADLRPVQAAPGNKLLVRVQFVLEPLFQADALIAGLCQAGNGVRPELEAVAKPAICQSQTNDASSGLRRWTKQEEIKESIIKPVASVPFYMIFFQ